MMLLCHPRLALLRVSSPLGLCGLPGLLFQSKPRMSYPSRQDKKEEPTLAARSPERRHPPTATCLSLFWVRLLSELSGKPGRLLRGEFGPDLVLQGRRVFSPRHNKRRFLARQTEPLHPLLNGLRSDAPSALQIRHQKGEVTNDVYQSGNSSGLKKYLMNGFWGKNLFWPLATLRR